MFKFRFADVKVLKFADVRICTFDDCHFGDLLDGDNGLFAMCLVDFLILADASWFVKGLDGQN